MKNKIVLGLMIVCVGLIVVSIYYFNKKNKTLEGQEEVKEINEKVMNEFNTKVIRETYQNNNYLISPYSIEIALNMLKDGAKENSKDEIEKLVGTRKINDLSIPNKLNIANATFIKNSYAKKVKDSYYRVLKNNYQAEVIYDEFKTPDKINNWVKEKTNGMIEKILDTIDANFVLGLINATALDIKWYIPFDCSKTIKEVFYKKDGTKINVEMMHQEYQTKDFKYINESDLKGIILPYEKTSDSDIQLEFIGLMPNDITNYINNIKLEEIDKKSKEATSDVRINLSLPRFTYDYEIKDFIETLNNLGIKDVFNEEKANLEGILDRSNMINNLYVDTAIHMTKIELNEKGTKAAAVTYFGTKDNALHIDDYEKVNITFDKPFIYMIRDKKTKEIIFFGGVFEPNLWKGITCSN